MNNVPAVVLVVACVVGTILRIKRYLAVRRSKAGRASNLLKRATRAAMISQAASQTSSRLSLESSELSNAATVYFSEAQKARNSSCFFRFVCLQLYGKWLFYRAGWLVGRAMQINKRAESKLQESTAILGELGEKRDS
jgi:hypothetical protein